MVRLSKIRRSKEIHKQGEIRLLRVHVKGTPREAMLLKRNRLGRRIRLSLSIVPSCSSNAFHSLSHVSLTTLDLRTTPDEKTSKRLPLKHCMPDKST